MMDSRRADSRFEVRIAGKLMWANGVLGKDCTIKDLFGRGAKVDTTVFTNVPEEVDLFEGKSGNIFECAVRRQQGPMIGQQFIDLCSRIKRRVLIDRYALCVMAEPAAEPAKRRQQQGKVGMMPVECIESRPLVSDDRPERRFERFKTRLRALTHLLAGAPNIGSYALHHVSLGSTLPIRRLTFD